MNTHTLNSVTLQTLGNYRTAATRAMVAYRFCLLYTSDAADD